MGASTNYSAHHASRRTGLPQDLYSYTICLVAISGLKRAANFRDLHVALNCPLCSPTGSCRRLRTCKRSDACDIWIDAAVSTPTYHTRLISFKSFKSSHGFCCLRIPEPCESMLLMAAMLHATPDLRFRHDCFQMHIPDLILQLRFTPAYQLRRCRITDRPRYLSDLAIDITLVVSASTRISLVFGRARLPNLEYSRAPILFHFAVN